MTAPQLRPAAATAAPEQRRYVLISIWQRRRSMTRSSLAVRLVVGLTGLAMIAMPARPVLLLASLAAAGVVLAVASPARAGAAVGVLFGIWSWIGCYGVHGEPALGRVLAFAVALYLFHSATALAAAVPIATVLYRDAALRWAGRCALHLGIAGVLAAVVYNLSDVSGAGSYLFVIAGLAGVIAVLAVITWLLGRTPMGE